MIHKRSSAASIRLAKFLLPGLLALLISACSGGMSQRNVQPFTSDLELWPDLYRQNFAKFSTFIGKAELSIESPQLSGNVSLTTHWVNPDKLFLKAEGPLGVDVGKIFLGPNRFVWYNQYENHFTSGSVNDPYLNRFLQTTFTFQDLRSAMLGRAPEIYETLFLTDRTHGIFTARVDDIEYRYLVNPATGLLESCEMVRDGRVFLKQKFQRYQTIDGVYLPGIITITLIDQQERISIFYKDIKLNKPVNAEAYVIEIGPKVEQLNLE